ncbi:MAG: ribonuclease III domain-containing protein [Clostridia bacterium]|nr:ribonuclease III domain-containing protein [Clostridia bacterium]MDD4049146.1 ribonuclease III domain-containing protein [Clostridia bacterium]
MVVYPNKKPGEVSPLVLAYLGDAVYELYVRRYLINKDIAKVNKLHKKATSLVSAVAQARFLHGIEATLTEEEKNIVRRGRNAKSAHIPKNTEVFEYRLSTGFEALIGYLFLAGKEERLGEIMSSIFKQNEIKEGE